MSETNDKPKEWFRILSLGKYGRGIVRLDMTEAEEPCIRVEGRTLDGVSMCSSMIYNDPEGTDEENWEACQTDWAYPGIDKVWSRALITILDDLSTEGSSDE